MNIQNILIIKLRYIGDVVLCTPVLRAFKEAYPKANLVCVVNPGTEKVLGHNPHVDDVLLLPRGSVLKQFQFLRKLRSWGFDCVIDLTDGDRSAFMTAMTGAPIKIGFNHENRWRGMVYSQCVKAQYGTMHMVDYHAEALKSIGVKLSGRNPEIIVNEKEVQKAQQLLQEHRLKNRPWIMIHPSARYWFKAWPAERFAALSDWLAGKGYSVVLVGDTQDKEVEEKILRLAQHKPLSFIGQTSLLELAALMKQCHLFVGNDGGPMHIAAAVGCPVLALFGPSDPAVWGPKGNNTSVIYKGLDCRDCFHPGCFRGEESCMKQISIEEVCSATSHMLAGE